LEKTMKRFAVLAALLLAPLGACSNATEPSAGVSYSAARTASNGGNNLGALTFRTVDGETAIDWLARGATIDLALNANGTTTGRLVIPGLNDDGEEQPGARFEASLAGTWTTRNGLIKLDHDADTFLRDMEFVSDGSTLSATRTFDGVEVTVVLHRVSR
jgi:hypothetical protein